jgi:hypothetical protein
MILNFLNYIYYFLNKKIPNIYWLLYIERKVKRKQTNEAKIIRLSRYIKKRHTNLLFFFFFASYQFHTVYFEALLGFYNM